MKTAKIDIFQKCIFIFDLIFTNHAVYTPCHQYGWPFITLSPLQKKTNKQNKNKNKKTNKAKQNKQANKQKTSLTKNVLVKARFKILKLPGSMSKMSQVLVSWSSPVRLISQNYLSHR